MQSKHNAVIAAVIGITFLLVSQLAAQAPAGGRGRGRRGAAAATGVAVPGAPGAAAPAGPPRGGGGASYPPRPPADPAVVARGKTLFDVNCASCHASDLRGTPNGINVVRNQLVLDDQNGELIGKVVAAPHANGKAAKLDLNAGQVLDLATYMHTFQNYRNIVKPVDPNNILVGNAQAGQAYFTAHCASCHSVTGNLAGIGSKFDSAKLLQNAIVSGGGGGGRGGGGGNVTVTVTMPNGTKYEGRQILRDDFLVTLQEADGTQRTIRRNGDVPKVEVHDTMKAHRDFLKVLTDDDIHNLTAYLVTVK